MRLERDKQMSKRGLTTRMMVVKLDWAESNVDMVLLNEAQANHSMQLVNQLQERAQENPLTEEEIRARAASKVAQPTMPKPPLTFSSSSDNPIPPELMLAFQQIFTPRPPPVRLIVWSIAVKKEQYEAMGSPRLFDVISVLMQTSVKNGAKA